jgi:hypothetical protein
VQYVSLVFLIYWVDLSCFTVQVLPFLNINGEAIWTILNAVIYMSNRIYRCLESGLWCYMLVSTVAERVRNIDVSVPPRYVQIIFY